MKYNVCRLRDFESSYYNKVWTDGQTDGRTDSPFPYLLLHSRVGGFTISKDGGGYEIVTFVCVASNGHLPWALHQLLNSPTKYRAIQSIRIYRILGIFRVGKFWRKGHLESMLNFHRVLFSLFQRLSVRRRVCFIFRCVYFWRFLGGRELSEN